LNRVKFAEVLLISLKAAQKGRSVTHTPMGDINEEPEDQEDHVDEWFKYSAALTQLFERYIKPNQTEKTEEVQGISLHVFRDKFVWLE